MKRQLGQQVLNAGAIILLLAAAGGGRGLAAGQQKQTFAGTVTDEMCPTSDHSKMQMGATDADCARACADAHGAGYVLYDGKNAYRLSDQKTAGTLAARKVRVVGTLDEKTRAIRVESMTAIP